MAIIQWISTLAGKIMRAWTGRYRPERHYMRGAWPGVETQPESGRRLIGGIPRKKGSGKPEPLASIHLRQAGLA